ncbi:MAG: hypothetical protein JSS66_10385 [Armatimonadetes bacterium]|nr:hypothetical protein [Armatimonadota bacterium]
MAVRRATAPMPDVPEASPLNVDTNVIDFAQAVSELRGEVAALRGEVACLRSGQAAVAEPEIQEHPDPIVEPEVSPGPEESEADLPEAVEADPPLDEGSALTQEEMDALFSATTELAQTASSPEEPDEPELAPVVPVEPEPIPVAAPVAKSEPEPDSGFDRRSEEAELGIMSVEEIQAMLGVPDAPPEEEAHVSAEPEIAQPVVEPIEEASAVEEDDPEVEPEPASPVAAREFSRSDIEESVVARVAPELAIAALSVPVCLLDNTLHCLSVEPFDDAALNAIGNALNVSVSPHPASISDVVHELRQRYGHADDDALVASGVGVVPIKKVGLIAKILRRSA